MNRSLNLRFNFQILSKVFFVIYLVYSNVLRYAVVSIRGLSIALLIIALAFQIIHDRFRLWHDQSLLALLIFALYALVSGFFVAQDIDKLLNTLYTFIEYLLVFYLVFCFIATDGKPDFPMIAFISLALTITFFLIFRGIGLKRISIAETVNVNTVGVTLAFSIGFILYLLIAKKNTPIKWVIGIASIAILLVGIMLTVSKKAIIGGAALIILWIVLCYRFTFAKMKTMWKLLVFLGVAAIGVYIYRWFTSRYALQIEVMMRRMDDLYVSDSDQARLLYIKEGFRVFLSHPIFGVGFNNARYYMPKITYTHCFYSELTACTGIIGTIIFGYAMLKPFARIVKARKKYKSDTLLNTRLKFIIAIYIVFFAINFVQIAFYAYNLLYVLAILCAIGYCMCKNEKVMRDEID